MMGRKKEIALILVIMFIATTAVAGKIRSMSVQVREAQLRDKPSPFGKVIARLNYADTVQVTEGTDPWLKAVADDREGWIHSTAVTRKKIELRAGDQDVSAGATSDEIVLAGKGFNQQVESEYRKKNAALDYTWVDRMETFMVSEAAMAEFLKTGGLEPSEGGAR